MKGASFLCQELLLIILLSQINRIYLIKNTLDTTILYIGIKATVAF